MERPTRHLPGLALKHHKNTSDHATVQMPVPKLVKISMSQHMGAPCAPLVKVGDEVKLGQKIGENKERLSAPIYASVSGKVTAIEDMVTITGSIVPAIVIESDGKQEWADTVKPPVINSREDFLNAVYENGMVGLGGAGFPTHTKLSFNEEVDTLIINGAECEPYITSDNREILENGPDIIFGIQQVQKYLNIPRAYIGIESNKPSAIKLMKELTARIENIKVVVLPAEYPQGAEKVLIYSATSRVVPEGALPSAVGVVVMNVTSISKFGRYIKFGRPLVAKRITVDGDCIVNPQNVRVAIGTSIQDVVDFCGGFKKTPKKILYGGPMMGVAVTDTSMPIIKNNNAILALSEEIAVEPKTTACIRCGKCIKVCSAKLMPVELEHAYDAQNAELLERLSVNLCINCGSCTYICPAKRNLAQKNQLAKEFLRQSKQK